MKTAAVVGGLVAVTIAGLALVWAIQRRNSAKVTAAGEAANPFDSAAGAVGTTGNTQAGTSNPNSVYGIAVGRNSVSATQIAANRLNRGK